jgi:hypothetical protein
MDEERRKISRTVTDVKEKAKRKIDEFEDRRV